MKKTCEPDSLPPLIKSNTIAGAGQPEKSSFSHIDTLIADRTAVLGDALDT